MQDAVSPAQVLQLALSHAEHGWRIFPCHTATDGRCSCSKASCKNAGKHPRTRNGLKDATVDRTQIERWWSPNGHAPANIAIATGATSGIVVIDIDPRHGGDQTLAVLESSLGPLPRDCTVHTGGGGLHIYLAHPSDCVIRSRNGWRQGIDVKSDGGFVIGPPSTHQMGTRYEWQCESDASPSPIPPKWLNAITEKVAKAARAIPDERLLLLKRADRYVAKAAGASEGGRNTTAFQLAGHIAAFVTRGGERLREDDVLELLQSWNHRCTPPLEDEELQACVASALRNGTPRDDKEVSPPAVSADQFEGTGAAEKPRKSQATQLVELAEHAELFHDGDGESFARFEVAGHFEICGIRTRQFRTWMGRLFYLAVGTAASAQALQDAIGVLEGKARYECDERSVHVRVAGQNGNIYIDLCNQAWQVIEIAPDGWQLIDESPVMFRRAKAMQPLPQPSRGGNLDELRRYINVSDDEWALVAGWLVAGYRPLGPYPVLDVQAEHGGGKSTGCRMLRALLDPNTAMLRSEPREPRDLMIAGKNGWVAAFDNLSGLPAWLSDCLCRLSTGGGFSTRTLYENDEETIFNAQRPVMINGIEEVATRADLLDRCLIVNLPRIEPNRRRSEAALWADFELARPRILGGLLDAVAAALRNQHSVNLPRLPRMADFAIWATAAEPALRLAPGQFLAAYTANRAAGNETAIEASPAGKAVVEFIGEVGHWSGTATQLLAELEDRADDRIKRSKAWPSSSRGMGGVVKRLAPNLREAGIEVDVHRTGRTRVISMARTVQDFSVTNVTNVTSPEKEAIPGDDLVTQTNGCDANDLENVTTDGPSIAEKYGSCDVSDVCDAKIPPCSLETAWTEV